METTLSNLTLWKLYKNQLLWWEKRLLTTKTRDILINDYFRVSSGLCPSVNSRLLLWAWYNKQHPHNGLWNIRIFIGYWKVNDILEGLEGREVRPIIIWAQAMFNGWTGMIMQARLPQKHSNNKCTFNIAVQAMFRCEAPAYFIFIILFI